MLPPSSRSRPIGHPSGSRSPGHDVMLQASKRLGEEEPVSSGAEEC